jgi:hypothetical protein
VKLAVWKKKKDAMTAESIAIKAIENEKDQTLALLGRKSVIIVESYLLF